jgi:hypothetical protein
MYGTLACAEHFGGAAVGSASAAQKPNLIRTLQVLEITKAQDHVFACPESDDSGQRSATA